MQPVRISIVILFLLSWSLDVSSQQTATVQRDAQAIGILQQSFLAMGGQNLLATTDASIDFLASDPDDSAGETKVTSKLIGTQLWRTDAQTKDGAGSAWIFNGSNAQSIEGSDTQSTLSVSVAEAGNWLVPIFSIIGEFQQNSLKITYLGLEGSNHHLQIQRTSSDPVLSEIFSPCDLYFDAKTILPTKLVYFLHPPANLNARIPVEVTYSDWRSASGLAIPFYVSFAVRGHLITEYRVKAISTNVGLSTSTFALRSEP